MIMWLLAVFVATVWTGPACDDSRLKLRRALDFPRARAKLLPPPPEPCGLCGRRHKLLE